LLLGHKPHRSPSISLMVGGWTISQLLYSCPYNCGIIELLGGRTIAHIKREHLRDSGMRDTPDRKGRK
jgi:hypothetical protein